MYYYGNNGYYGGYNYGNPCGTYVGTTGGYGYGYGYGQEPDSKDKKKKKKK